jgi:hypothetical protein
MYAFSVDNNPQAYNLFQCINWVMWTSCSIVLVAYMSLYAISGF